MARLKYIFASGKIGKLVRVERYGRWYLRSVLKFTRQFQLSALQALIDVKPLTSTNSLNHQQQGLKFQFLAALINLYYDVPISKRTNARCPKGIQQ